MNPIEVKATFKSISIKDKTTLQFELSPFYESELPNLTKVANAVVFLTIANEQLPLPIEDVEAEYETQEAFPIDDITDGFEDDLDESTLLSSGEDDSERDGYYPNGSLEEEEGDL